MAIFNDFSWSASRDSTFQTCKRAYYYQYYESWGGWEKGCSTFKRLIYIMKNIRTMPLWSGSIVHEVLAEALREYAINPKSSVLETAVLLEATRKKLRSGWKEAVSQQWFISPKKVNLDGLFYGNGKTLPTEETEKVATKAYGCIQAFADSAVLKRIKTIPFERWKPVDELESFMVDDLKVWGAIDFAFTDHDGKLCVIDWKTGAENKEAIEIQLACYAYYANYKWGISPENIRVFGCYLANHALAKEYILDADIIISARQKMIDSAEQMKKYLRNSQVNEAVEEDFPLCENDWHCRYCCYRGACEKFVPRDQVHYPDFIQK